MGRLVAVVAVGRACYGRDAPLFLINSNIREVLRYTVFWLKLFLNDGGSSTRNRLKYICNEVYRFLAEVVSE